jgi:uncharacterized PurR-regulated membrane protein YhhQ (DUF165 family)
LAAHQKAADYTIAHQRFGLLRLAVSVAVLLGWTLLGGLDEDELDRLLGAVLSAFFASPALLLASTAAFLLAELADFAVYAPLRKRHLTAAVLASGAVGAVIDSAVFLWLAFGSLAFIEGQIIGKLWMSVAAVAVLMLSRRLVRD